MRRTTALTWKKRSPLLGLAGLTAGLLALTGCSTGAYPVDFFQEMHYSQSVRRQEPPVMTAPDTAVPFRESGGPDIVLQAGPAYDLLPFAALVGITENPLPDNQTVRDQGAALFARNCAVCHGPAGDAQGTAAAVMRAQFTASGANPPADLTAPAIAARSPGALFATLTHGQGVVPAPADAADPSAYATLTNMPSFKELLSPEERWALVRHIQSLGR